MMLCASCPRPPVSPSPPLVQDGAPGAVLELSPKIDVQVVRVQVPVRIFVVQSDQLRQTIDVANEGEFPREITIQVANVRDGSANPIFVPISNPGWVLSPDGQCTQCMQCCPRPPVGH